MSPLVGAGFDSTGTPVQSKMRVWGELNVTSYTTGGETVSPADIRLETIDFINFDVRTVNDAGTEPAAANLLNARYINSSQKVMIKLDENTEVTSTQDASVMFDAVGNFAGAPDLT